LTKKEAFMLARRILSAALLAFVLTSPLTARASETDGIVRIKSAYSMPETIKRLKKDVADKGIMFFDEIDQSKLAADAAAWMGATLRQQPQRTSRFELTTFGAFQILPG
jgi:hypothetical protein